MITKSINVKIISFLIILYWQIYENVLFIYPDIYFGSFFQLIVYAYKFAFPFLLFIYAYNKNVIRMLLFENKLFNLFNLFFIFWALISTLLFGELISWIKIVPLYFFSLGVTLLFIKNSKILVFVFKCIIFFSLVSLLQYILIHITGIYSSGNPGTKQLTGPFGLFGVTNGNFYLPGLDYPIVRLTGFWKEPSNASAVNFASFFLALFLYKLEKKKIWFYLSLCCLLGGGLSISNAGYLALGGAFFVGFLMRYKKFSLKYKFISFFFFTPFIIGLVWLALFSRSYFSQSEIDSNFIKAVSGIRGNINNLQDYDPSSGRVDLIYKSIDNFGIESFFGIGLQKFGVGTNIEVSGSAPIFWLTMTGYVGLFILLLRDFFVFLFFRRFRLISQDALYILQAFIVILLQQSIYGVWMDANYLLFISFIFSVYQSNLFINLKSNKKCVE
jgi:hypothetical protein